jgi:hypothetical protein
VSVGFQIKLYFEDTCGRRNIFESVLKIPSSIGFTSSTTWMKRVDQRRIEEGGVRELRKRTQKKKKRTQTKMKKVSKGER